MAKVLLPLPTVQSSIVPATSHAQVDLSKSSRLFDSRTSADAALPSDFRSTHLISSPYPDEANQLDLRDLDTPYRVFALALTAMRAVREDYAIGPYLESFNWSEVFSLLRSICQQEGVMWQKQEFYVVIFRSKLTPTADRTRLGELDKNSHQEACASGGLLKYWFGSPDAEGQNLATCLWRKHEDAVAGGKGPWHKLARGAARTMYEKIDFHVHRLIVEADAKSWRLEEFVR